MAAQNPEQLARAIRSGDRRALARGITLIESTAAPDRSAANQLLNQLIAHSGGAMRVGISGAPGAGKSTFIETLGNYIIEQGKRLAVLAVDPSSTLSGGSILGDKTRMENLSRQAQAFIRPSPAGQSLGGVARSTRDCICLVEAAGFDVVLVETVGVGQSESKVALMTDMFVLLLLPAAGDELQGIKRGVVELADLLLVNKADGDLQANAERTAAEYGNALRLLPSRHPNWKTRVFTCSALQAINIDQAWQTIETFYQRQHQSGALQKSRSSQARAWLRQELSDILLHKLHADQRLQQKLIEFETAVTEARASPRVAAEQLVAHFLSNY